MTDPTCATCRVECAAGIQIAWKDLRGAWQLTRYCGPCARHNGDLQDSRAGVADEQAERAGV